MSIQEISTLLSVIASAGLALLATAPWDNPKPWMRILPLVFGLTAFLWMPWVVRLGHMNTQMAFPKSAPTEVESKP